MYFAKLHSIIMEPKTLFQISQYLSHMMVFETISSSYIILILKQLLNINNHGGKHDTLDTNIGILTLDLILLIKLHGVNRVC